MTSKTQDLPPETQAVVFLNPYPFDSAIWHDVIDILRPELDLELLNLNLPGSGSEPQVVFDSAFEPSLLGQYSPPAKMGEVSVWLAEQFSSRNLTQVVLVGVSMGGYVALRFVQDFPHLVSGLVLVDSHPFTDAQAGRENRLRLAQEYESTGVANVGADFVSGLISPNSSHLLPLLEEIVARQSPFGMAWSQRAMASRGETLNVIQALGERFLWVLGADDKLITSEIKTKLQAAVEELNQVIVPDAGHLSPIEKPESVASEILRFLKKQSLVY